MQAAETYRELIRLTKEAAVLSSCMDLLHWEQETYMPTGGVENRGNQLSLIAGLTHDRRTDPRIGEYLGQLDSSDLSKDPTSEEAVNLREIRRSYDRQTKLPKSLVEEMTKTTSLALHEWATARKKSDYQLFKPWLKKIFELKRQEAECLGYTESIYDPLLDQHETGATAAEITGLFKDLREELVPLTAAIAAAKRQPDEKIITREYPIDRQKVLGEIAASTIGFDFERGRLDVTNHPFCSTIGPGDCRLTTRYSLNHFSSSFFGTLHEAGHGMYEQGLLAEHYGTPMGTAVSLGVHESQSRLWENIVGRSRAFWTYFYPFVQRLFPAALQNTTADEFHFAANAVRPSLIRVEADEVTYNLHILIRFELEQAILTGDLSADEVPAAWNEKYSKYLGITPPDDANGCLQDIHWSSGLIGYFPTYTLGNLYAAQLREKAGQDLGDLDSMFARGEFAPLLQWLRKNVHQHGSRYLPKDLIRQATGTAPTHRPLIRSLREKFGKLYELKT